MPDYLGLRKIGYFFQTLKNNGGIFKSLYKVWRFDTFKTGCLMGVDANGNRYYENKRYMMGRCRWVEHADHYKWEYEGSQVTQEWFGWLHYMTDDVPCYNRVKQHIQKCKLHQRWLQPHQENLSGTTLSYYPYPTVPQHVQVWDGKAIAALPCPIKC